MRRLFLGLALLLSLPSVAVAGEPALLGARLDTSGTWVAVISKATVVTHVELFAEGDVRLAETSFDLAPGERRQVAFEGSGLGYVVARMTDTAGGQGAVELRAWLRYVPPPPSPEPSLLPVLLLLAAGVIVLGVRKVRHHAPSRR